LGDHQRILLKTSDPSQLQRKLFIKKVNKENSGDDQVYAYDLWITAGLAEQLPSTNAKG
jgi:hypothetical protein